jgi:hypothetical protein
LLSHLIRPGVPVKVGEADGKSANIARKAACPAKLGLCLV